MADSVYIGVAGWSLPSPSYGPKPGFAPGLPLARFGEEGKPGSATRALSHA